MLTSSNALQRFIDTIIVLAIVQGALLKDQSAADVPKALMFIINNHQL